MPEQTDEKIVTLIYFGDINSNKIFLMYVSATHMFNITAYNRGDWVYRIKQIFAYLNKYIFINTDVVRFWCKFNHCHLIPLGL